MTKNAPAHQKNLKMLISKNYFTKIRFKHLKNCEKGSLLLKRQLANVCKQWEWFEGTWLSHDLTGRQEEKQKTTCELFLDR